MPLFFDFSKNERRGMSYHSGKQSYKSRRARQRSRSRRRTAASGREGGRRLLQAAYRDFRARALFHRTTGLVRNPRRSVQSHLAAARRYPGNTVSSFGWGGRGVVNPATGASVARIHTVAEPDRQRVQVIGSDERGRVVSAHTTDIRNLPFIEPLIRTGEKAVHLFDDITHLFG